MEITTEKTGDITVATPQGEYLIASNVDEFKRDIASTLDSTKLLFDMSKLQFVDSSGIGAILSCLRRVSANGGDLKLFGMSKPVRAVFQITRMHRIFDTFDTKDEALNSFAQESATPA